jgi:hypothetical protein
VHEQGEDRDVGEGERIAREKDLVGDILVPLLQLGEEVVDALAELLAALLSEGHRAEDVLRIELVEKRPGRDSAKVHTRDSYIEGTNTAELGDAEPSSRRGPSGPGRPGDGSTTRQAEVRDQGMRDVPYREACEAYIRSQAGEGWTLVPARYDDGGYSGSTLERPALGRLLADLAAGKIDTVVVYKVIRGCGRPARSRVAPALPSRDLCASRRRSCRGCVRR